MAPHPFTLTWAYTRIHIYTYITHTHTQEGVHLRHEKNEHLRQREQQEWRYIRENTRHQEELSSCAVTERWFRDQNLRAGGYPILRLKLTQLLSRQLHYHLPMILYYAFIILLIWSRLE